MQPNGVLYHIIQIWDYEADPNNDRWNQQLRTGCSRVRMIFSCSSVVVWFIVCSTASKPGIRLLWPSIRRSSRLRAENHFSGDIEQVIEQTHIYPHTVFPASGNGVRVPASAATSSAFAFSAASTTSTASGNANATAGAAVVNSGGGSASSLNIALGQFKRKRNQRFFQNRRNIEQKQRFLTAVGQRLQ